jgi:hypothetical protein
MKKFSLSLLFVLGIVGAAAAEQGTVNQSVAVKSQAFHAMGKIQGVPALTDKQLAAIEGASYIRTVETRGGSWDLYKNAKK